MGMTKINEKSSRKIPLPVVRRLAKYREYVNGVACRGCSWITSMDIAADLGLTSATVRRDIFHLNFNGCTKRGYDTAQLENVLTKALGLHKECNVVIVGAGNLGRALALHGDLVRMGFKIRGIFDNDKKLKSKKVAGLVIQGMNALSTVVKKYAVGIGIIAVPSPSAQSVANQLVKAGVHGILNLACANVLLPKSVHVVEARIAASLSELCCCVRMAAGSTAAALA